MLKQSVRALAPGLVERRRSWQCRRFNRPLDDLGVFGLVRQHLLNGLNRRLQLLIRQVRYQIVVLYFVLARHQQSQDLEIGRIFGRALLIESRPAFGRFMSEPPVRSGYQCP
jgi:hypothetical protein